MRKSMFLLVIVFAGVLLVAGCQSDPVAESPGEVAGENSYADGTYRGSFSDRGYIQVNIQFTLEDNVVTDIGFRHLEHGGIDYRQEEEDTSIIGIREQHEQLIDYLVGEDVRDSLNDLYEPGDIVDDVDIFTGATVRASKVISAIRDALNRGVYRY